MLNHTSSQQRATRNDENRGYLTLMLNVDLTHHQIFVSNGFSQSRNIPLSENTKEPFGKQNTSYPPVSSWSIYKVDKISSWLLCCIQHIWNINFTMHHVINGTKILPHPLLILIKENYFVFVTPDRIRGIYMCGV